MLDAAREAMSFLTGRTANDLRTNRMFLLTGVEEERNAQWLPDLEGCEDRELVGHCRVAEDRMQVTDAGRITTETGKRGGNPCVRGLRITVWDVLGWLGCGMTEDQILDEHPDLERADFPAVYRFAADAGRRTNPV